MKQIAEDIFYVGVDDNKLDLFEGQFVIPDGVSYNSYVIMDEKIAVIDSVDAKFGEEWLNNLEEVLGGRKPDYLVIQHMEPDHSASVRLFTDKYPEAQVVGNQKTFVMLAGYFGEGFPSNQVVVKEGETLSFGKHAIRFIMAPMVHWPEVMFSYDTATNTLFSADAFGRFGVLAKEQKNWQDEARRYYFGIVGKYGAQVKAVFTKIGNLDIDRIAPLHGPVLSGEQLSSAIHYYKKWAAYTPEVPGVLIACSSIYGHTLEAAKLLKEELEKRGQNVVLIDLIRRGWADSIALAFRYPKLVVAATTYNGEIFPAARNFINGLAERNYQWRTVGFIENGSWAPVCAKQMKAKLEECKNLTFTETTVKIRCAVNEQNKAEIIALADELTK